MIRSIPCRRCAGCSRSTRRRRGPASGRFAKPLHRTRVRSDMTVPGNARPGAHDCKVKLSSGGDHAIIVGTSTCDAPVPRLSGGRENCTTAVAAAGSAHLRASGCHRVGNKIHYELGPRRAFRPHASGPSVTAHLRRMLERSSPIVFTTVAGLAGFSAYFSMYAFRKPFSAATFADVPGWTFLLDYKIALVIAQVI